MKLSEAIRLGAMLGPQVFGSELGFANSSCAIGAAILAIGVKGVPCNDPDPKIAPRGVHGERVNVTVPWDMQIPVECPACVWKVSQPLLKAIAHLNDEHRWTRESIADWVTTIEEQVATPGPTTEVAEEVLA